MSTPKYLTVISEKKIKNIPIKKIIFLKLLYLKSSLDLKTKREEVRANSGIKSGI